ncbi:MAG: glutamate--tRNA ligase [Pseudomonadota bacterium]
MKIHTRFAPSPTGDLHIGGVRTALFAYLFARHHNGKFYLRIEDTDRERSSQASIDAILQGMAWLNLQSDEEIIYQSQRFERYQTVIQTLLDTDQAYYCDCSKERLQTLREQQMVAKQKPRYDQHCRQRKISDHKNCVVRFKNPQSGIVTFHDLVLGTIDIDNHELDDLIIARSDGTPTYNLTVVVDDMDMAISHVIRGMDHINNTPRQINLFKALGATPPIYGHVPMIHGSDGKKLSKRRNAVNIMHYRDMGYLPEALLNYLLRLGWSHGDQEIFSRQQMIALFDGKHISKSPAIFDVDKLNWLNQHYLKSNDENDMIAALQQQFTAMNITTEQGPPLADIIHLQADRVKTLKEMAEKSDYFYKNIDAYDEKAAKKHLSVDNAEMLIRLYDDFAALADWQADNIQQVIHNVADDYQLKLGKVAQPIRVAVTGGTVSPPMGITLQLLGRDRTLKRLRQAIAYCQAL